MRKEYHSSVCSLDAEDSSVMRMSGMIWELVLSVCKGPHKQKTSRTPYPMSSGGQHRGKLRTSGVIPEVQCPGFIAIVNYLWLCKVAGPVSDDDARVQSNDSNLRKGGVESRKSAPGSARVWD